MQNVKPNQTKTAYLKRSCVTNTSKSIKKEKRKKKATD